MGNQSSKSQFDEIAFRRMIQASRAIDCESTEVTTVLSAIGDARAASATASQDTIKAATTAGAQTPDNALSTYTQRRGRQSSASGPA